MCIILNPEGKHINKMFKWYKKYKHDILKEKGKIIELSDNDDIVKFWYSSYFNL